MDDSERAWSSLRERLPSQVVAQLDSLVEALRAGLGATLRGAILHGSAASSGFRTDRSDLDLLVIASTSLTRRQREAVGGELLAVSNRPCPLELSIVTLASLRAWTHPCACELHFGEAHRERFLAGDVDPQPPGDPDLAMHLTVARARGVDLVGNCPVRSLPAVPRWDYLDAVLEDFEWAARQAGELRDYQFANACRTLAYLETGAVLSKTEGIDWCRDRGDDTSTVVARVTARLRAELGGEAVRR